MSLYGAIVFILSNVQDRMFVRNNADIKLHLIYSINNLKRMIIFPLLKHFQSFGENDGYHIT